MCGILGSVNFNFRSEILDLILHRGPDYGNLQSFQVGESQIIFGHRRLSILDLTEQGNQPMNSDDNNFSLIFNGEIYNYLDLKTTLDGINFKGHSDTEVLLHYLIKNGIQGMKDFNGVYSFAFLDKKSNKLYLARDPYGVKPFYYSIEKSQLIFSSEIKPIKKLINTSLDNESLAELLKLRYNPAEDTLYREINKLNPGHCMVYDLMTHQSEISSILRPAVAKRNLTFEHAVNQYADFFEKAVVRQLKSDVEIGTLLSGGVDSALVTYFAVKNSKSKIKSFTVGYDESDDSDELEYAAESARILGTDHHQVVIKENDFLNGFEKVIKMVEEPLGTTSSIPMYYLNREVSKYVKVTLTGQGADEPLGGYPRYKGEIYREYVPGFVIDLFKPIIPFIKNEKIRRFIFSAAEKDEIRRFEKAYTLFQNSEIKELIGYTDQRSYSKIKYFYNLTGGKNKNPAEAMMTIDLHMNLADDLLLYTDKVSMNFGVETRVPILDFELLEFIESLPLKYKINRGEGKYIHREFAKRILPESIASRKKLGFMAPTQKWFQHHLGDLIIKTLEDESSNFNRIFEKEAILKVIEKHKKGFNQEKQLFLLLSLYYWFKDL